MTGLSFFFNRAEMTARRSIVNSTRSLNTAIERLSTGYKINRAADDPAGLAIAESLRSMVRGTEMGMNNVQEGISALEIADGGLESISNDLQRIRELAVEAANGTVTDYTAINNEINALRANINTTATTTNFNGIELLDGSVAAMNIQAGATSAESMNIASGFGNAQTAALGLGAAAINSSASALAYIGTVDTAISNNNVIRSGNGAQLNSLEGRMEYLQVAQENYAAAEGTIRNADVARETSNLTRYQILQQAGVASLTAANSSTSLILSLLNTR